MRTQHDDDTVWTWEPVAAVLLGLGLAAVLAIHTARGVALWAAGLGFHWPPAAALFTSLGALLAGDVHAGLPTQGEASILLTWILAATLTTSAVALLAYWGLRRLKRTRFSGMANKTQANRLLGIQRLRANRQVIRPDLYRKPRRRRNGAPTHRTK